LGVDLQVNKTLVELQNPEKSLRVEQIDLQLAQEYRYAIDYLCNTTDTLRRRRTSEPHPSDDQELLSFALRSGPDSPGHPDERLLRDQASFSVFVGYALSLSSIYYLAKVLCFSGLINFRDSRYKIAFGKKNKAEFAFCIPKDPIPLLPCVRAIVRDSVCHSECVRPESASPCNAS
jgi:hypothetical protein